jgi:lipid II isoglutaminyl synthase (glutamine-hydrolysing)
VITELTFFLARVIGGLAARVGSWVGNGSVIGGRIALMIMPTFIARARRDLDFPIVFVLGSNGKTTTSKYLTQLAESAGETVLSNVAGSNMRSGIAALAVGRWRAIRRGAYSLGVFEVDEGYAAVLGRELLPEFALVLNVQIDQIYRLHEPERVRDMFRNAFPYVTRHLVVNGNDGLLVDATSNVPAKTTVSFFGLGSGFPVSSLGLAEPREMKPTRLGTALSVTKDDHYVAIQGSESTVLTVPTTGVHFALNGVAALEMVRYLVDDRTSLVQHGEHLSHARPAFGRGETITSGNARFEIILFKNRPSLQLNLNAQHEAADTVVIAFDEHSRDPSWLFAVDYSSVSRVDVVSGEKADFFELALKYADVEVGSSNTNIVEVVSELDTKFRDAPPSVHRLFLDAKQMTSVRGYFGKKMAVME